MLPMRYVWGARRSLGLSRVLAGDASIAQLLDLPMIPTASINNSSNNSSNNNSSNSSSQREGEKERNIISKTESDMEPEEVAVLEREKLSQRLQLRFPSRAQEAPFSVDFGSDAQQRRQRNARSGGQGGGKELVVRAAGPCNAAIDLTGGLCRDSAVLASQPFIRHVIAMEQNLVLHSLVQDGLIRAPIEFKSKFTLFRGNSVNDSETIRHEMLLLKEKNPDLRFVCFLDPMYPEGFVGKASAVKKDMQIIHRLLEGSSSISGPDSDFSLFLAALALPVERVAVKRPLRAPDVAQAVGKSGLAPCGRVEGSGQRFDIYSAAVARAKLGMSHR